MGEIGCVSATNVSRETSMDAAEQEGGDRPKEGFLPPLSPSPFLLPFSRCVGQKASAVRSHHRHHRCHSPVRSSLLLLPLELLGSTRERERERTHTRVCAIVLPRRTVGGSPLSLSLSASPSHPNVQDRVQQRFLVVKVSGGRTVVAARRTGRPRSRRCGVGP